MNSNIHMYLYVAIIIKKEIMNLGGCGRPQKELEGDGGMAMMQIEHAKEIVKKF